MEREERGEQKREKKFSSNSSNELSPPPNDEVFELCPSLLLFAVAGGIKHPWTKRREGRGEVARNETRPASFLILSLNSAASRSGTFVSSF